MLSLHLVFPVFVLLVARVMAQSTLEATTPVVSLLGMIPQCSVPCVLEDLFTAGGCPMTIAQDLAGCACTNITMQATLSTCVQKSCRVVDQNLMVAVANSLCEAYPKESRSHELETASIVTIVVATMFLVLRLYSRWLKTRRLWSDDAYAIVAAVFLITVSIIILEMSLKGFGLHYWNVPTTNAVALLKLFYVCQMLYVAVQIFSKVAILSLYSRLFPDSIKGFRWSVRAMVAFVFLHGLIFFLLIVVQCLPISSIWDKTITDAKCLPVSAAIGFTGAGLSIVEDFVILVLPLPVVWRLQMSTKKKLGVILLIGAGSFASITSIVRLKYVLKYSNSFDSTWDNVDVIKWSLIEILSACFCGNLLALRPLIEHVMPPLRSMYSRYGDRRSSGKSSERISTGVRRLGTFGRSDGSSKPRLIPTLHLTRMSISSTPTPRGDWHNSTNSDQDTIVSPRTPTPAHLEKTIGTFEEGYVQSVPYGKEARKKSTAVFASRETELATMTSQTTIAGSIERPSRDESVTGLVPPARERPQRISGPWSYAFAFLDRR